MTFEIGDLVKRKPSSIKLLRSFGVTKGLDEIGIISEFTADFAWVIYPSGADWWILRRDLMLYKPLTKKAVLGDI